MFVSMMTTAIAVRKYGIESLSLAILAMQVASYAQLIEVGIPTSMSRRLPRYLVNADIPKINAVCSSSLVMLIAGSIALILALPAFAMILPRLLAIGNDERKTIGLLFGLVVFFTAMQLPLRISYGILSSMHRFSTYFTLETLSAIAKLIMIVALFSMFVPPLWLYIMTSLVPPLIIGSIEFKLARESIPSWVFRVKDVTHDSLKELFSVSGAAIIGTIATALISSGSSLALGILVEPIKVGIYAIPSMLAFNIMSFASSSSAFLSPIASQLYGREDQRLKENILISMRYATAIAGLVCLGAWIVGPLLLRAWIGKDTTTIEMQETMAKVLMISSIGIAVGMPGTMVRGALAAMGRHWAVSLIELAAAISGLVLGLALCKYGKNRAPELFAYAMCGANMIKSFVLLIMVANILKISQRDLYKNAVKVIGPIFLGVSIALSLCFQPLEIDFIKTILIACITLGVTTTLFFWLVLEDRHRKEILYRCRLSKS